MKKRIFTVAAALVVLGIGNVALAQDQPTQTHPLPWYIQQNLPKSTQGVWSAYQELMGAKSPLNPKEKYLIGLGVAAQIPCVYCIYAQTQYAKNAGASDEEIHDAIAVAGFIRLLSTVTEGNQVNMEKFKASVDQVGKKS